MSRPRAPRRPPAHTPLSRLLSPAYGARYRATVSTSRPGTRPVPPIHRLLRERRRRHGGDPLVTYYRPADGIRIELSATTFAGWVDKTANLLVDDLGLDPGDRARLGLAEHHPGHWVTLVWTAALWQVGLGIVTEPDARADLLVLGPEAVEGLADLAGAGPVVACSLHPLGLGFTRPLPAGVTDFGAEVPAQPDAYVGPPAGPDEIVYVGAPAGAEGIEYGLRWSEVIDRTSAVSSGRRLVRPADPPAGPAGQLATVVEALVDPVVHDGSVVVVEGPVGDDELGRIRRAEHADV